MTRQNKKAKFWIRFLAKTIDVVILTCVLVAILVPCVSKTGGKIHFVNSIAFYAWCITTAFLLFCYFYILPILNRGQTFGFMATGIKVVYKKSPWKAQALRETTFSFIYIFNIFLLMSIINYSLIDDVIGAGKDLINNLPALDKARVSFYVTATSIGVLVSLLVGISIIVKKGLGLNDSLSESQAIWKNKFVEVENIKNIKNMYKPHNAKDEVIEWIE